MSTAQGSEKRGLPWGVIILVGGVVLVAGVSAGSDPPPAADTAHHHNCGSGLIALTFDDGPSASVTPQLMSYLEHHHLPATFFVVGERISGNQQILRQMSRAGFRIGNHTYHHEHLQDLSDRQIRHTLLRTRGAISATGARQSPLMRPPYAEIDHRVRRIIHQVGMVPVLWTVDSRDWTGISTSAIVHNVLSHLRHGHNIVLQHDGIPNSPATLSALPQIVRSARHRGYCFRELDNQGHVRDSPPAGSPRPPIGSREMTSHADR